MYNGSYPHFGPGGDVYNNPGLNPPPVPPPQMGHSQVHVPLQQFRMDGPPMDMVPNQLIKVQFPNQIQYQHPVPPPIQTPLSQPLPQQQSLPSTLNSNVELDIHQIPAPGNSSTPAAVKRHQSQFKDFTSSDTSFTGIGTSFDTPKPKQRTGLSYDYLHQFPSCVLSTYELLTFRKNFMVSLILKLTGPGCRISHPGLFLHLIQRIIPCSI